MLTALSRLNWLKELGQGKLLTRLARRPQGNEPMPLPRPG